MANWKKGDVVVSKSGGPLMTIQNVHSDGLLECSWFRGDNELTTAQFASEAVESPPEGGHPGRSVSRG